MFCDSEKFVGRNIYVNANPQIRQNFIFRFENIEIKLTSKNLSYEAKCLFVNLYYHIFLLLRNYMYNIFELKVTFCNCNNVCRLHWPPEDLHIHCRLTAICFFSGN